MVDFPTQVLQINRITTPRERIVVTKVDRKLEEQIRRVKLDKPLSGYKKGGHCHIFTTNDGADVIVRSHGMSIFADTDHIRRMQMRKAILLGLATRVLMPDANRWTVNVGENLGFHTEICRGPMSIRPSIYDGKLYSYCAQIGHTHHYVHNKNPLRALAGALDSLRRSIGADTKLLNECF